MTIRGINDLSHSLLDFRSLWLSHVPHGLCQVCRADPERINSLKATDRVNIVKGVFVFDLSKQ